MTETNRKARYLVYRAFFLCLTLLLSSCSSQSTNPLEFWRSRLDVAREIANGTFEEKIIPAKTFSLFTYFHEADPASDSLKIYIEGDGKAWQNRFSPSSDPTPSNPLGLKLAKKQAVRADNTSDVLYIARPCQYLTSETCDKAYWTGARFAPEVFKDTNQVITLYTKTKQYKNIEIIGYSGGGTIAALVTAQRRDIDHLTTIAGVLNHKEWTRHHKVTPLRQSHNPIDYASMLINVPQTHYCGQKDETVPCQLSESYKKYLEQIARRPLPHLQIQKIGGYGHVCCWVDQ